MHKLQEFPSVTFSFLSWAELTLLRFEHPEHFRWKQIQRNLLQLEKSAKGLIRPCLMMGCVSHGRQVPCISDYWNRVRDQCGIVLITLIFFTSTSVLWLFFRIWEFFPQGRVFPSDSESSLISMSRSIQLEQFQIFDPRPNEKLVWEINFWERFGTVNTHNGNGNSNARLLPVSTSGSTNTK